MYIKFHKKLPGCFPKWLYYCTFPPMIYETSSHSTSSLIFGDISLLNFNHSGRSIMILLCTLFFISFMNNDVKHLFFYGPFYISLYQVTVQIIFQFLNWVVYLYILSYINSLYILDANSLSDIYFLNIFSSFDLPVPFLNDVL